MIMNLEVLKLEVRSRTFMGITICINPGEGNERHYTVLPTVLGFSSHGSTFCDIGARNWKEHIT